MLLYISTQYNIRKAVIFQLNKENISLFFKNIYTVEDGGYVYVLCYVIFIDEIDQYRKWCYHSMKLMFLRFWLCLPININLRA